MCRCEVSDVNISRLNFPRNNPRQAAYFCIVVLNDYEISFKPARIFIILIDTGECDGEGSGTESL